MAERHLTVRTDGAARGNPGPAGIGFVVEDGDGRIVEEASAYIGERTNNQAEYEAVVAALEAIGPDRETHLEVFCDSQLVVRQLNGDYRVKDPDLRSLYIRATRLLLGAGSSRVVHVPRGQNGRADALANEGIDAHLLGVEESAGQTVAGEKSSEESPGSPGQDAREGPSGTTRGTP